MRLAIIIIIATCCNAQPYGVIVPAAQWFVDSVGGSDSNAGTSVTVPFQTIAKLQMQSIQSGDTVAVKCGSSWRETYSPPANTTLISYGICTSDSDLPLFDGSNSISSGSWSKTGGQTNVYQITVTTESPGAAGFVNVFENGNIMARATSIANCDAIEGSAYPSTDSASPVTLYIHPTGNGNPASNGKTYDYAARTAEIYAGNNVKIINVRARRTSGAEGIVVCGNDCQIVGGVFSEGARHNLLTRKNTYVRGTKAYDGYNTGGTSLFVYFIADAAGSPATYIDTVAAKTAVSPEKVGGYDGHVSGGQDFGTVTFLRASCDLCATAFAGGGVDVLCYGCVATGSITGSSNSGTRTTLYSGCTITGSALTAISPTSGTTTIQNCELSSLIGTYAIQSITATTAISITDSNIHTSSGVIQMFQTLGLFTSLRNTIVSPSNLYLFGANTPTINSDYNTFTFASPTPMKLSGADISYATYKTQTGQDAHSSVVP